MVELSEKLVIDESKVAGKVMDGEAIIIDLSTGVYYSADNVGGFVWEQIEAGGALGSMVDAVCTRYAVEADQAQTDVQAFTAQLVEANLVTVAPGDGEGTSAAAESGADKLAYEAPALVPYEEMADLLALDPPMPLFGKE